MKKYKIKGHYKIALNQYFCKSKNDISENNISEYEKYNYIFSERLLFVVEIFLIVFCSAILYLLFFSRM